MRIITITRDGDKLTCAICSKHIRSGSPDAHGVPTALGDEIVAIAWCASCLRARNTRRVAERVAALAAERSHR